MLYFPNTRVELSLERPVASGVVIPAEGLALIADYTGGVFGARPSTGAATDQFIGVSVNRVIDMTQRPNAELVTSSAAPSTALLQFAPLTGTLRVETVSTGVALTVVVGAPAAGEVQIDPVNPLQLNFNAAQASTQFLVSYVYALTVAQAIAIQGNQDPGGPAGRYLGQIGVITRGDVFTDQYDTLADWTVTTPPIVTLGANGQFTIGGAGPVVPGYVISTPSAGNALLGLHINAN